MTVSDFLVVLNMLLYLVTFIIYYKHYKSFNVSTYILLIYTISSLASIYYYFTYEYMRGYVQFTLIPFLYLYIMVMVYISPVLYYDSKKAASIYISNETILRIITYFIIVVSIEPFLENLLAFLRNDAQASVSVYEASASGYASSHFSSIGGKLNRIGSTFCDFSLILIFYYFTKRKIDFKILIGLFVAIVSPIMCDLANGGRSFVVNIMLSYGCTYFIFRKYIPSKRLKKINRYSLICIFSLVIGVSAVTIYRFSSIVEDQTQHTIWSWVSLYAGEGFLNFNTLMWHIKEHTQGDYCFSLFKDMLGFDTFEGLLERRAFWESRMGIPPLIFYTFIGDLYCDLGAVITVVFVVSLAIIFYSLLKNKSSRMPFQNLILVFIISKIASVGFTFYAYNVYIATQSLVLLMLLYAVFYCVNKFQY